MVIINKYNIITIFSILVIYFLIPCHGGFDCFASSRSKRGIKKEDHRVSSVESKSVEDQAKEYFEMAVEAFAKRNYTQALSYFNKSYELNPKPKVLYNIGMCHKALMEFKESMETFKKYLEIAGGKINKSKRLEVEKIIAELENYIGKLNIEVSENGAVIFLDGKEIGYAPLGKVIYLNPGTHTIEVDKSGFKKAIINITLENGEHKNVSVRLIPVNAEIKKDDGIAYKYKSADESSLVDFKNTARKGKKKRTLHAIIWSIVGAAVVGGATAGGVVLWQKNASATAAEADWTIKGK